ncbi:pyridoxal phosphate-dependent transferase [Bisporella sp. PMI_857]|nr:pyridoxal phosphate-dependent transferase [Bisporella sp. PMI_857]
MSSILSNRGQENVAGLSLPWRFAPGPTNRYDKVKNPNGLISFATAEIVGVQDELAEFVQKNVTIPPEAFLYSFSSAGGPRFPVAMANFLNENFAPFKPVTAANIITGGGVTTTENMIAFNIADPGDGILVSAPIYGRFELDFGNEARLKIVYARMNDVDSFASGPDGVVGRFRETFDNAKNQGIRIRAVLLSNPSNPLGEYYPRQTLKDILEFCEEKQIHLISDEVYGLSSFDTGVTATPFTSVLSFDTMGLINPDLVHVLYGLSKDFGAAGLRLGCLITRSEPVLQGCTSIVRFHNPSGPSIAIGTAILEDKTFYKSFLARCREHLATGYRTASQALDRLGINYRKSGNAGLFLYVDFSKYLPKEGEHKEREFVLAQHFVDHGIFLHPGEEHCENPGWFRLVFASLTEEELAEALKRLSRAVNQPLTAFNAPS